MSAVSRRTPAQIERLARLQTIGGWLLALGLLVALVAAGLLLALERPGLGPRAGRAAIDVLAGRTALGLDGSLLLLAAVVGGLVALVGLAVFLIVPGLDPRLAKRDFDRLPTVLAALAGVFVLGNLLTVPILVGSPLGRPLPGGSLPAGALVAAMLATQLAIMAVLIWRIVRPGVLSWDDIGLTDAHLDRRLLQGAVGGLIIFVVATLASLLMRQVGVQQTQLQMFESVRGASLPQFLAFWLAAAVVAPICEESFFRGYVFTALRGRYGRLVAYPLSALLFAAIHGNLPAILPIVAMALGLAFLYDRSGSVVPGIVAHALNNSVALTILYAGLPG